MSKNSQEFTSEFVNPPFSTLFRFGTLCWKSAAISPVSDDCSHK